MKGETLNECDVRIIEALANDSDLSNKSLAGILGISEASTSARRSHLQKRGVISKYEVNYDSLGDFIRTSVVIKLKKKSLLEIESAIAHLRSFDCVIEVCTIEGEFDLLAQIVTHKGSQDHIDQTTRLGSPDCIEKVIRLTKLGTEYEKSNLTRFFLKIAG